MGLRIENISKPRGLKKKAKRVGRGIGSGKGKTSGRGHKGAKSRSGGGVYNPGFEGGQMPLVRKLPKRGFTNKFKVEWDVVNVSDFQNTKSVKDGSTIDREFLFANRMLRKKKVPFKVLGDGELKKKLTIKANAFSKIAEEKIKAAGGQIEVVAFKKPLTKRVEANRLKDKRK